MFFCLFAFSSEDAMFSSGGAPRYLCIICTTFYFVQKYNLQQVSSCFWLFTFGDELHVSAVLTISSVFWILHRPSDCTQVSFFGASYRCGHPWQLLHLLIPWAGSVSRLIQLQEQEVFDFQLPLYLLVYLSLIASYEKMKNSVLRNRNVSTVSI